MSIMICDRCQEWRDSDYVEFFETKDGDTCIYCMEEDEEDEYYGFDR